MKKSSFIAAAFAVALAGGLASCSNNQQSANVVPAVVGEVATLPIAYVNIDSLFSKYNFALDINEELMKKQEEINATLNSQAAALDKEVSDFQRKLQTNAFLSEERAQNEANRIQKKKDQLDQLALNYSREIQELNQVMQMRLQDTIQAVLKDYNAVKKFELILSNTHLDNILLDNPKYDITGELIEILNNRYEQVAK